MGRNFFTPALDQRCVSIGWDGDTRNSSSWQAMLMNRSHW